MVDRVAGQGNLRLNLRYDTATDTVGGLWTLTLARGGTVQGRATLAMIGKEDESVRLAPFYEEEISLSRFWLPHQL